MAKAKILSIATTVPPKAYSQQDVLNLFKIKDPRIVRLFTATQIEKRHLYFPDQGEQDEIEESQAQLLKKHLDGALEIGIQAIQDALKKASLQPNDIDYLCVVTSTGFIVPSLSAHIIKAMNLRDDCQRVDIVGMGCNAGLNGLNVVNNWARINPDKVALLLCVEICSAIYVNDGSLRTCVVNSLFGDGAAAIVVKADTTEESTVSKILDFHSYIIPEAIDAMRYDWDEKSIKYSFFLHHANPYVVGKHIEKPVKKLLDKYQIQQSDIRHWIIHGGGRNVISAVKYNLCISSYDMRHTISVLKDFGNVSSASFLFSYQRLLEEDVVKPGDYGMFITIGPGAQLETALIQW